MASDTKRGPRIVRQLCLELRSPGRTTDEEDDNVLPNKACPCRN